MNRIKKWIGTIDGTHEKLTKLEEEYYGKVKGTIYQMKFKSIGEKYRYSSNMIRNFGQAHIIRYTGKLELNNLERSFTVSFLNDVTQEEVIDLVEYRTGGQILHMVTERSDKGLGELIF